MTKQHKVLLSQEAYKALMAESMVRNGEDLKSVASRLILEHVSPTAKNILNALSSDNDALMTKRIEGQNPEGINASNNKGIDTASVDDLNVFKTTKKDGKKTNSYWNAKWTKNGKRMSAYLGSTKKLTQEAAWKKARDIKAQK